MVFYKSNLLSLIDGLKHNGLQAKCSTTKFGILAGAVLGVHITYYLLQYLLEYRNKEVPFVKTYKSIKDLRAEPMEHSSLNDLEQIPGVGKNIAQDMRNIGIHSVGQLKDQNPEKLYQKLCDFKASPVDRCMLYVLRCAVYYASNTKHDPWLLKWWNWKDSN